MLFAVAAIVAALALSGGIGGGFMLDDPENLKAIRRWLDGDATWYVAVFGNHSGMLGRSVSMASFAANAALSGMDPVWFKLVNIAIHLANGLLVALLAARLLAREPRIAPTARNAGWLLGAIWLLLPVQVSTVLYVVQRMTELACLFALAALLAYVVARERLALRRDPVAFVLLWLGVPVLVAFATLAKESGLLVIPMIAVLELTMFARLPRTRAVNAFVALVVVVPCVLGSIGLAFRPSLFLAGYAGRDFTLAERLLSEPRILWDYARAILVPYSPGLGLIHDDFPKSTGLLQPWTTLPSLLGWIVVATLAWISRRRLPAFACGIGLFLCGHAMESTIFPLELYFEHRNYLPSLGLLLAVFALVAAARTRLPAASPEFRRLLPFAAFALLAALAVATAGRAQVWGSPDALLEQSLAHNPASTRLRSLLAVREMGRGNLAGALAHIDAAEDALAGREAGCFALWRLLAYCKTGTSPPPELVGGLRTQAPQRISTMTMTAYELVALRAEPGDCPGLDLRTFADAGLQWVDGAQQPDTEMPKWRMRYYAARILGALADWPAAITVAERSWVDSDYNVGPGILAFQLNASAGRTARMREIHAHLAQQAEGTGDLKFADAARRFGEHLDELDRNPPPPAQPDDGG